MGRIADAYGVRGWVKVAPQAGVAESLAAAKEWWIGDEAREVGQAKIHGATVVARLSGIATREEARALKGQTVSVRRESLPEPQEGTYYLADLVGLEVVNGQGVRLGTVKRFYSNGPQDVMEVAGDRERLIPWVAEKVLDVDLDRKLIQVDWQADW
ncbi:MAG TPA: ribosome maturation factor RimM [Burkholderiales bacterium]|nr:ribosome maturation factor RimM [Burkholderiales bacterium]